jgi:hypothetical protein
VGVANSVRVEFQRPHGNPDGPVVTIQINVRSRTGTYIPQPPRPSVVVRRSVSSSSSSSVRSTRACCKEKRRVIVFTLGGVSFRPCVFFPRHFLFVRFFVYRVPSAFVRATVPIPRRATVPIPIRHSIEKEKDSFLRREDDLDDED